MKFDYTNFQIIPINDTHTVLNGYVKFLKGITAPWHVHWHTEQYERGHWLQRGYVQDIRDFCKEVHNPVQPWYYVTTNFKGCPIPAGVSNE